MFDQIANLIGGPLSSAYPGTPGINPNAVDPREIYESQMQGERYAQMAQALQSIGAQPNASFGDVLVDALSAYMGKKKSKQAGESFADMLEKQARFSQQQTEAERMREAREAARKQQQEQAAKRTQADQIAQLYGPQAGQHFLATGDLPKQFYEPEEQQEPTTAIQNYEYLMSLPEEQREAAAQMMRSGQVINVNTGSPEDKAAASKQANTDRVVSVIDEALGQLDNMTTGMGGALTSWIPQTPAFDLAQDLQTIGANTMFDKLQNIRDLSPTGGALGQVSDREGLMLRDAMGALSQYQSKEELQRGLMRVRHHYQQAQEIENIFELMRRGEISPEEADARAAQLVERGPEPGMDSSTLTIDEIMSEYGY